VTNPRGEDTPATRFLKEREIVFSTHHYDYEMRGGTPHAAGCLGVAEHVVIKTLVMRTDAGRRLLVLMHGDRQVSTKRLVREVGARKIRACSPEEALKATGYVIGGISPFGTRTPLPVYAEASIFDLPHIYINGGRRGLLLGIAPSVLSDTLDLHEVAVAAD
jgi:Cys-tRNA(Pro) deacylase